MALRPIPIAPGSRPDPRFETTYQASRGGHCKAEPKPVPGTPKSQKTEAR
ncbi:hypothetical protein OG754_40315 (plasmid) [Streptomyces decoyicus]|nr:hypothetical protein [Streptomyces decoyicus]